MLIIICTFSSSFFFPFLLDIFSLSFSFRWRHHQSSALSVLCAFIFGMFQPKFVCICLSDGEWRMTNGWTGWWWCVRCVSDYVYVQKAVIEKCQASINTIIDHLSGAVWQLGNIIILPVDDTHPGYIESPNRLIMSIMLSLCNLDLIRWYLVVVLAILLLLLHVIVSFVHQLCAMVWFEAEDELWCVSVCNGSERTHRR